MSSSHVDEARPTPDQVTAFLAELAQLTARHGIEIGGCGCEGSPWLVSVTGQWPTSLLADALEYDRGSRAYTADPSKTV